MSSQYVKLSFTLTKYADDEDTTEQQISFEGHNGWQQMQFHKLPPTEEQIKLLAELSRILAALASSE